MPFNLVSSLHLLLLPCLCAAPTVSAYVMRANEATSTDILPQQRQRQLKPHLQTQTTALPSHLLFQSPALDNYYKDYIVTSKPLNLRKYKNGKTKKTKKDSKIYFIPIPPMPYRYIPGVGYDYQPMQIRPLLQEAPAPLVPAAGNKPSQSGGYTASALQHPHKNHKPHNSNNNNNDIDRRMSNGDSKLIRVHHNDYYFNGRPFQLLVAHAGHKQQLTPLNMNSRFYFNKNILY